METYVSVVFMFFGIVFGVLASNDSGDNGDSNIDLYVPDDYGNILKLQYVLPLNIPYIPVSEYPNLIFFHLYTRSTKDNHEKLVIDDVQALNRSHFDMKKPTVFITPGWVNTYDSPASTMVRDAYLEHGDYNIILIDWAAISKYEYVWVSEQVVKVSQFVARMIDFLASQGMDLSNVTNVGHSLGAHIAGLSSYYAKKKVNYVVGLDPAGPFFHFKDKGSRLSEDDGNYVQVIHTSTVVGLHYQLGTADFYVNGGFVQNGCILPQPCTHVRAYEYFAISINNSSFPARSCDSYTNFLLGNCNSNPIVYMGGATPDFNVRGKYYLITNSEPPFHTQKS